MEKIETGLLELETIKSKILTIRGVQVMIDRDLAELYEMETKRINEQVKEIRTAFPKDIVFNLLKKRKMRWSKIATTSQI
jgi:ORF6N domain.